MMRRQRSRALQATPPLATFTDAVTKQEACAPHAWAAMGRGRVDPAPHPYKYCPERKKEEEGGKGRETERERSTVFEREGRDQKRETTVFVRGKGTEGGKQQGFLKEKKSEGKGPKQ